MYQYELEVLEKYGIHTDDLVRGRGAWICETDDGLRILQEYPGSVQKLIWQKLLQEKIEDEGVVLTDMLIPNQEGELYSRDRAGTVYILRSWYKGRECDTHSAADIRRGIQTLAGLHTVMTIPFQEQYAPSSLYEECQRHNREMRKTAAYLKKRQQKNEFEDMLSAWIGEFIRQGESAIEKMDGYHERKIPLQQETIACHGDYTHHNVLFCGQQTIVTGFQKWNFERPSADLFQFMRKILEKNDWNSQLFIQMLDWYQTIRPLDEDEMQDLLLRLSYPWKNWKLVNYYMQRPKTMPVKRNIEKIQKILRQEQNWLRFVEKVGQTP